MEFKQLSKHSCQKNYYFQEPVVIARHICTSGSIKKKLKALVKKTLFIFYCQKGSTCLDIWIPSTE